MPAFLLLIARLAAAPLLIAVLAPGPVLAHEEPRDQLAEVARLLAARPDDPAFLLRRAQLLSVEGRWSEAAMDLDRAKALAPGLAALDLARGALLLDAGEPGAALASLDRFLSRVPEHGEAAWLRARSLAGLGRHGEAVQQMDRAIVLLDPVRPDHYIERARLLATAGEIERALSGLDQARERLGPLVSLESEAIGLELALGRHGRALARLDRVAPQFDRRESVLARRGEILAAAGRPLEAGADFTAAIAALEALTPAQRRAPATLALETRLRATMSGAGDLSPVRAAVPPGLDSANDRAAPLAARASGTGRDARAPIAGVAVPSASPAVTRGPYLQVGTPTGVRVRWRTDVATDSRVRYGLDPSTLSASATDATVTGEHEVSLTGLAPDQLYYYSIGSTTQTLAGDASFSFVTAPASGTWKPTRLWIIGDSGLGNASAGAVRDAYATYTGVRRTDLWLMLGDNAYSSGTDAEYQAAVFGTYGEMLKRSVLWPTRGNHDVLYSGANNDYYDIFTMPTAGEAGGVASGSEAYYSFDYGNLHLICLDSEGSNRTTGGPMLTWLRNDLAATNRDWILVFWHHPPYTKGSHDSDNNSDSGGRMRDMRENALPILDSTGVDLVLTGHSHSYERSCLLNGHYGTSGTLTPAMKVDPGDGRVGGDGPYAKPSLQQGPFEGAVYAVAGSSAQIGGGTLNHPVMISSLNVLGSLVVDVTQHRLDARFLDSNGAVRDSFTLLKGGVVEVGLGGPAPSALGFSVPRPNPSAGGVDLAYALPRAGNVSLAVHGADGRRVATLVRGAQAAGPHRIGWRGRDDRGRMVAPGVYFGVLEFEGVRRVRKLVRLN